MKVLFTGQRDLPGEIEAVDITQEVVARYVPADWKARAEMYRRQLGGVSAALRRERQKTAELERRLKER